MRDMTRPTFKWLSCIAMIFCCAPTNLCATDRVPFLASPWTVEVCQPPKILCARIIEELALGSFLDFRASPNGDEATLRLLSPFAVERIEPLDKTRCPAKLCVGPVALAGLQEDLLKQGYYTQRIGVFPGGAVITLRTERIDGSMKVLKGRCRFDLNPKCSDSGTWLQDDHKSGEKCGFGLTRLFVATPTLPAFMESARFAAATPTQPLLSDPKSLSSVTFDTASVKVFELLYVHKICPSAMTIICNG
jgi:hypothetical protein